MDFITSYINQYGYIVLFLALMLELLALPLPGELLMGYAGVLAFQGHLSWIGCILAAGMGSVIGMTIAYGVGYKLGTPFFNKYGKTFHMGPERIERMSKWFSRHGNKLLIIAYFLPVIRHITGYFSGMTRLPFRTYALYAYSGSFLWVTTFITLGKLLGPQWDQFHNSIKKYFIIGMIVAVILFVAIYIYKQYKLKIKETAINCLKWIVNVFHTRKRAGFAFIFTGLVTLGFILLMIGMTQDFIGNEFGDFNKITSLLITVFFNKSWDVPMWVFFMLGSRQVLIVFIFFTLGWILWKDRDKKIELLSLLVVVGGGELYEESLRRIFHHFSPIRKSLIEQLSYTFPSEQSLMAFVIYGFAVFMLVRHSRRLWIPTLAPIVAFHILLLIAISRLYLSIQYPSDIAAGYVFGGVWLGLNILLLETFRLMKGIDL
ncbi:VTT domain-containing protein [Priestia megaterium]|uniref:VTT domain-containing protein n=1 Tax=Priestia megaterium TaxID=1404 RepID=UPI00406BB8F7